MNPLPLVILILTFLVAQAKEVDLQLSLTLAYYKSFESSAVTHDQMQVSNQGNTRRAKLNKVELYVM